MYIYKATNKINGKVYIGQTKDLESRKLSHQKKSYNPKTKFHISIKKHGFNNFDWEIICECSQEEVNDKEIFYIKEYNSYEKGYNATLGGNFCTPMNKTISEKISSTMKGKVPKGGMKGLKHSEETKKKMSESATGVKCKEETKKKLSLLMTDEVKEKLYKARWHK